MKGPQLPLTNEVPVTIRLEHGRKSDEIRLAELELQKEAINREIEDIRLRIAGYNEVERVLEDDGA